MAIVSEDIADEMVAYLRKFNEASHASIIGKFIDDHNGKVLITNPLGGKRVVHMPIGEQLPRIC